MKGWLKKLFNLLLIWVLSLFPFVLKDEHRLTSKGLRFCSGFFVINLGLSLTGIYGVRFLPHFNLALIGVVVIQFIIFFLISSLLVLIISLILHLFSKLFKSQGGWRDSLKASFASTTPIVISFLSDSEILQTLIVIYLLMVNFYFVHKYPKVYAILNIGIPALFYVLFLMMMLNYQI